jgi:HEPN domain-containing protein
MNPFSLYHFHQYELSDGQQQRVEEMVAIARPLAVFLLGATQLSRRTESIFNPEAVAVKYIGHCFYLLLLPDGGSKKPAEWEDQLEHSLGGLPFTVLALHAGSFTSWLKEGHPFACKVRELAPLLYQCPGFEIIDATGKELPAVPIDDHAAAMRLAQEFMAGAQLYQLRNQYKLAAFMLHQAAEQVLRSLLRAGTGYYANIHHIERLLRYGTLVSSSLHDVFDPSIRKDKQLLSLLQKAYIAARYENDFVVKGYELEELFERVGRIVEMGRNA